MKKFSLVLSVIFLYNTSRVLGAEEGMPQLNPEYWAAQIFWLILIFSVLYIVIWKIFLPKIVNGIENRKLKVVSKKKPTNKQLASLKFAFNICKFVKSNAIVLVNDQSTIGIGAGQPSRLDSCKIASNKAQEFAPEKLSNSVAASDAFFPFADGIKELIESGIKAIIQPGGSINDKEVIKAANDAGISMVFTGTRHFKH